MTDRIGIYVEARKTIAHAYLFEAMERKYRERLDCIYRILG